jgi:hypothetical protein
MGAAMYTFNPNNALQSILEWREIIMTARTIPQNNSLQKGCRNLAELFGDAGKDMRKVLKPEIEIPWTGDSVREYMFNPIAKIMFDGRTSSELSTEEIQEVWKVLIRHTGEKHGVTTPWPDRHNGGKA